MENNVIIVGSKALSKYLLSALMASGNSENIVLRGRGKNISKTVALANILSAKHNFKTKEIKIGEEDLENGKKTSYIEIQLEFLKS
ncbi:MAG: hypothetical protein J7L54_05510 [Elusimicrobia bacterium]|nr:hypothetical protein [Elusimicrobiota bacterium]